MANALYPKWKGQIMQHGANSSLTGTVKIALVDTGTYTYSSAHQFLTSLSAGIVGTPQTLNSKTFTDNVVDGADVTFTAVTGASCEAIAIYIDTGTAGTSQLVAFFDTGVTGLPVTPNGGDININFNVAGIFAL